MKRMKQLIKRLIRGAFRLVNWLPPRQIKVFYVWPDFGRKAHAIVHELQRHGFDAAIYSGRSWLDRFRIHASRDLWIGFWNEYRTDYMPDRYIFYNGEQLSLSHWWTDENWTRGIRNAIDEWDYSPANEPYVRQLRNSFRHVPYGYSAYYEESYRASIGAAAPVEDIDVLFVGQSTDRRRRVIDDLRARGVMVHTVTRENPAHGAALDVLFSRAKIILSVYSYEDTASHLADYARLDHLLANGRFVVQERPSSVGTDPGLEQALATCSYDELVDTCVRYLGDAGARDAVARGAREWFIRERALEKYIPFELLRERMER